MILTDKQSLTMMLTHAQDNIRSGKIQNVLVPAEDLVVEGLQILLQNVTCISLVVRNFAAAKFIEAYQLGSAFGCFLAGLVYKYGFGIDEKRKDLELGNSLITVAAKGRQDSIALHFVGLGLIADGKATGIQYLEASANLGCKKSSLVLAIVYLFRADIVPTSDIKAIENLQKLESLGNKLLAQVKTHKQLMHKPKQANR
jgi:hypothetical protein